MIRKIIVGLLFLGIALSVSAEALDTEDFKFVMSVPEGLKYRTYEKGRWGGIRGEGGGGKTKLLAVAYKGVTERKEIYSFGIELSEIEGDYWDEIDSGAGGSGFEWWEIYQAEGKNRSLFALVGKNAAHDIHYLFFILVLQR